jgi:hypothetical protein
MLRKNVFSVLLKTAAWIGFALLLFPSWVSAAEVMTNDGQKFDGKILEEQSDYLVMEIENGVHVRIEKSEVAYIQREDAKKEPPKEYPVLGVTYGSPSVVNLVAGYYLTDFGLKMTGAYWAGIRGIQADLSFKLVDHPSFMADLSLVGGAVQTSGATNGFSLWSSGAWGGTNWTYHGIGFDINYGGFAFETDLVTGPFPNPVAIPIQIGFIQRFN